MTAEQLKDIFESTYNHQQWITVLREIFGIKTVHIKPQAVDTSSNKWDAKGFELGNFETLEGRLVGVYEVQISATVKLERNKVGLRNLLKPIYDTDVDAALIVFNQGSKWRFSYVSQVSVRNKETNRREKKATDPKRYTYIFGKGQKCRTAAERFAKIQQQYNLFGGAVKLEDIEKAFSVDALTKDFYRELSDWYFRALKEVKFPDDAERAIHPKLKKDELEKEEKTRNATSTIRLITRIIFVWFLKQKGLVPDELFDKKEIDGIINYKDKTGSTYYKAILQNLFFATLNTEMTDENRIFSSDTYGTQGVQGYYRYKRFFKNANRFLELTKNVPFLNGGLFENLDKNIEDKSDDNKIRIDCFSNALKNEERLTVRDSLFFDEQTVDLSDDYGDKKRKSQKVRGLINILQSYNFTIEENTPFEIEIALDPELLGKVFENLLASYNPETETTARKMTGSFYTPREIVDYMVDESLKAYLNNILPGLAGERLNQLFSYSSEIPELEEEEKEKLIQALDKATILDPACGSGAFPMGVLHKMVWLLTKLDPYNDNWKAIQREKAIKETEEAFKLGNKEDRDERLKNISEAFDDNSDDYGRKLYLIENCIYGVDIQPIAVQIAKLRFFISLICDQEINEKKKNRGVRPLPNLETKFVAANTLIGLNKPKQLLLRNPKIEELETELNDVRHKHFGARNTADKRKWRSRDHDLREQIGELLKYDGWDNTTAEQIANWNPYDQNSFAEFYDSEWMFGIVSGFDIVIGNPPWGARLSMEEKKMFKITYPEIDSSTPNSFAYFIGWGIKHYNGIISYVLPDSILIKDYAKTRQLIKDYVSELQWYENTGMPEEYRPFVYVDHDVCVINILKQPCINLKYSLFRFDRESNSILETKVSSPKAKTILKEFDFAFNLIAQERDLQILRKIEEFPHLEEFVQCHEGIHTGNSRDLLFTQSKKSSSCHPLYYGGSAGDIINNYISSTSGWFVDYRHELIDKSMGYYASLRDEKIFKFPKIYITRTGNPFKAFLDYETYASNNFFSLQHLNYSKNSDQFLKFLLPFVISKIAQYFIRTFAAPRLGSTFIETKIFHLLKFRVPVETKHKQVIIKVVDYIILLKKSAQDSSFFERLADALIYELYFPEEINSANCEVLKHLTEIPEITGKNQNESIKVIQTVYEEISRFDHPICIALFNMDTIEEVAIIEGKKK